MILILLRPLWNLVIFSSKSRLVNTSLVMIKVTCAPVELSFFPPEEILLAEINNNLSCTHRHGEVAAPFDVWKKQGFGEQEQLVATLSRWAEGVGTQYQGPLQEVCVKAQRCGHSCRIRHYPLPDPRAGDPRASKSTPADNGPWLSTPHRTTHSRRLGLISGPAC